MGGDDDLIQPAPALLHSPLPFCLFSLPCFGIFSFLSPILLGEGVSFCTSVPTNDSLIRALFEASFSLNSCGRKGMYEQVR